MGEEENHSKFRGVQGGNGCVLPLPPYSEVARDSPATYQGGRHRGRRFGDLHGVLSADPEVGGMPGGRMSGKGKNPRETAGALNVSTLEGEGGHFTGDTGTATMM